MSPPRLLLLLAAVLLAGCPNVTTAGTDDFGVNPPGCRAPSACYFPNCACTTASGGTNSCIACDPASAPNAVCDCTMIAGGAACLDRSQVCVGRAAAVCAGAGARCVRSTASCNDGEWDLPQMVTAPGPVNQPHCPFVDDQCCLGPTPDLGVPVDAAGD